MATPEEWFRSLPIVTRTYFVAAIATTTLVSLGVINPYYLYLDFDLVFKFQIWRLVTCFLFFGKFSLQFIFQIYILVRYFKYLEDGYFSGPRGTADFLVMIFFGSTIIVVIAFFWSGLFFPGPALVFMTLYVWSRKDPHAAVMVYGFRFEAWHFPFVLLVFSVLIGSSPVLDVVGIIVGHAYHFLIDIVPQEYGKRPIYTPQFFYDWMEGRTNIAQAAAGRRAWQRGAGYRLDQ